MNKCTHFESVKCGSDYWLYSLQTVFLFWTLPLFKLKFPLYCAVLYHSNHVGLFATLWSLPGSSVHGDSQARIQSGLPCPPPGDLPNPGIKPRSPASQVDSLPAESQGKPQNIGVSGLNPCPADLPDSGIKLRSPALQTGSLPAELPGKLQVSFIYI